VALAECALTGPAPVGARVTLSTAMRTEALLFGESTGRVVVATTDPQALLASAQARGVPAAVIGETGGDRLRIESESGTVWIDAPLDRLHGVWSESISRRMEAT
jgi:phosphoribosylformylglycinamidine synthase